MPSLWRLILAHQDAALHLKREAGQTGRPLNIPQLKRHHTHVRLLGALALEQEPDE